MKEGANMADVKTNEAEMYYEQEGFEAKNEVEIDFQKSGGPYHLFIQSDISENGTDLATMAVYKDKELIYYETNHSEDEVSYYHFMKNLKDTMKETAPEYLDEKIYYERYGIEFATYENIPFQSIEKENGKGLYEDFCVLYSMNEGNVDKKTYVLFGLENDIEVREIDNSDIVGKLELQRDIGRIIEQKQPELLNKSVFEKECLLPLAQIQKPFSEKNAQQQEIDFQKDGGPYKIYSKFSFDECNNSYKHIGLFKDDILIKYTEILSGDTYAHYKFMREVGLELKANAPEYLNEARLHETYSNYPYKSYKNMNYSSQEILMEGQHPKSEYKLIEFCDRETDKSILVGFKNDKFYEAKEFTSADITVKEKYLNEYKKVVLQEAKNLYTENEKKQQKLSATLSDPSQIKLQIKGMLTKGYDKVAIVKHISKKTGEPMKNIVSLVQKSSNELSMSKNERGR